MIRNRRLRRTLGAVLIVLGAVLMWAAATPLEGSLLILAAIVLEVAGIRLERRPNGS